MGFMDCLACQDLRGNVGFLELRGTLGFLACQVFLDKRDNKGFLAGIASLYLLPKD